jgi:hypothetical protein
MIEERLTALISRALAAAASELGLTGDLPEVELSKPRQKEHGDFATNVCARGRPPRRTAPAGGGRGHRPAPAGGRLRRPRPRSRVPASSTSA